MSPIILISISWGAGMLLQAFLMLEFPLSRDDGIKLLIAFCAGIGGFIPDKHEVVYDPNFHILECFIFFALIFGTFFFRRIFRAVNEYVVMIWILLFLYVCCRTFGVQSRVYETAAVPAIASLVFLFTNLKPGPRLRAMLYFWFILMVTFVSVAQFRLSVLAPFLPGTNSVSLPWAVSFLSGMAFLPLTATILFLLRFIPLPGKHQSFGDRMRQFHEDTAYISSQFSDEQARLPVLIFSTIIFGGILFANFRLQIISDVLIINVLIIGSPYFFQMLHPLFGQLFITPSTPTTRQPPKASI